MPSVPLTGGAVLFGIVVSKLERRALATAVASVAGFVTFRSTPAAPAMATAASQRHFILTCGGCLWALGFLRLITQAVSMKAWFHPRAFPSAGFKLLSYKIWKINRQ